MLDMKLLRTEPELVKENIKKEISGRKVTAC